MEELTLEEVQKRRERKRVNDTVEVPKIDQKAAISGRVRIDYESMGRFSIPSTLYFKDYSTADINSIVMSSHEDMVATLVPILNGMVCGDNIEGFNSENMTIEEFVETLVAVKRQFNTSIHKHPYMCDCQYDKPEADQKLETAEINLNNIKYKSIEQVDEEIKAVFKENFDLFTDEEWGVYKSNYAIKHNVNPDEVTKESIINNIKVTEPFIVNPDGHEISLRLTRISDLLKAQKMLDKEYTPKIKRIQNRTEHGVPGEELSAKKQKEIDELQKEKAKKLLLYTKAFSIISLDGKVLSDQEKINMIEDRDIFPRRVTSDIDSFLDQVKHGIFDTVEFTCPSCGKKNKEDLQYNISTTELLPLNSKDERDNRYITRLDIRFGK